MLLGVEDSFLVEPERGLIVWTIYAAVALCACCATLIKGRVGWFFLGVVTGGLLWLVGAFLRPVERSPWTWLRRRFARP